LSKLANLRKANTGGAVFSNNADAPVASIFARMQGKQTPTQSNNSGGRKKYTPSRFRLKKGESKTLVILDEQFTYGHREHSRKKPDGYWETVRCISDYDSCPVCALPDNRPSDVIFLTCLDLTPWEKDGKTYEYTKRLLALKKGDYERLQGIASTQPNLRGVMLEMTRGHGDKESGNGSPVFVQRLTEEDLAEAFGSPEKVYPSGFVLPANNAIVPFDYKDLHPVPSRADLASHLGMSPRAGSREDVETPPWEENNVNTVDLSEDLPDYPDVD
jgi:hypothetical protein